MALGLAFATTVFAVVDGVLFRPLPYPQANRLYTILPGFTGITSESQYGVGPGHLADWSAAAPGVQFTGFRAQPWLGYGTGVNDDAAGVALVQGNFFDVLGVRPLIGGFGPEDFVERRPIQPVVILHDVWQGRFQGDAGVIGRVVETDPIRHTGFRITGIMPPGFTFPSVRTDVLFLAPFVPGRDENDAYARQLSEVIARVPESMTAEALRARVEAGMQATAAKTPPQGPKPAGWSDRGWRTEGPFDRADVVPTNQALQQRSGALFRGVFVAAILIVALGALNVSALMAARSLDRGRELGLRRALGASAVSIGGLIFAETAILIGIGAAAGLALAPPILRLALALLPDEIALLKPPLIDWRVVEFVAISAFAVAIPTSIWPIRRAVRAGIGAASDAGRVTSPRSLGRGIVVMAQVAGAFVLTVVGALLVSSLLAVYANDRPIRTNGVVAVVTQLMGSGGNTMARLEPILERLRGVSGVSGVAATSAQLLVGGSWPSFFTPPDGAADRRLEVDVQGVTADYYQLLEPQLVAGRMPTAAELRANAALIVVSERLARAYWPSSPAVGQVLARYRDTRLYTVVGVVRDVRWFSWDTEVASIYAPYELVSRYSYATLLLRTDGRTDRVTVGALAAIREADPFAQISRTATLDALFTDSVRTRRFKSFLFGSFAAAGLAVVAVGILGLIAMSTTRRTREIGIRYVLGSTRLGVVTLILREQLAAVAAGLITGGLASAWAATLVSSYLYGVTTSDARVWASATALIIATAALGALVPACRASLTDPAEALRVE
jgi:predicted permease